MKMNKMLLTCFVSLVAALMIGDVALAGGLVPARLFSDGVVLQAGKPIPVWGTGVPGTTVTVEFAGRQYKAPVDEAGGWSLRMDPLQVSAQGRSMRFFSDDGSKLEVKDVLVGEVWICSGQSNMAWRMQNLRGKKSQPASNPVMERVREELAGANDPLLRQFEVDSPPSPFEEAREVQSKRGWVAADSKSLLRFSGVAYFFASELRRELQVPVGLILAAKGGTKVEAWLPQEEISRIQGGPAYYAEELSVLKDRIQEWEALPEVNAAGKPKKGPGPVGNGNIPTTLFNGMIAPLVPFAVRGVIWYQGEANARFRSAQYQEGFTRLVKGWRQRWGQEPLYFFWCQLANFSNPDFPDWVAVSNQQRLALEELDHSGMAVLNDIGMVDNIHPNNKIDAGKRLSLLAFDKAYGRNVVSSGPVFRDLQIDGTSAMVRFSSTGTGLMVGQKNGLAPAVSVHEPLGGFELLDREGQWRSASAELVSEDMVRVTLDPPEGFQGLRYAWSDNPVEANLYNREGLPASLFQWMLHP